MACVKLVTKLLDRAPNNDPMAIGVTGYSIAHYCTRDKLVGEAYTAIIHPHDVHSI